jgi:ABC-type Mn2+/Zn2+ transport system permease subunit
MIDVIQFLWPAFLVAVCLVGIHAYFGIMVLARKVIFVDLALAQIAALGATVAFMLGHPPQSIATYGYSLTFTLLAAVLLAFTRAWGTRVPQEALIGVIYVVAAATAILLIDRAPQGAEHLKQILTGNILTSGFSDLAVIVPLYAASHDGGGIASLGVRVLCDFRHRRDQFGRDRRRPPCFLFPDYSSRHRRPVRGFAFEAARNRLDCRSFGQ